MEALDDLLGYQLRRASAAMMADLTAALAPLELSVVEMSVLWTIADPPGSTQSEVGRRLGIQRANMAPLVALLQARGLVSRGKRDGRSQVLGLTDAGWALLTLAREAALAHEARFLPHIQGLERARLMRALRSVWSVDAPVLGG